MIYTFLQLASALPIVPRGEPHPPFKDLLQAQILVKPLNEPLLGYLERFGGWQVAYNAEPFAMNRTKDGLLQVHNIMHCRIDPDQDNKFDCKSSEPASNFSVKEGPGEKNLGYNGEFIWSAPKEPVPDIDQPIYLGRKEGYIPVELFINLDII